MPDKARMPAGICKSLSGLLDRSFDTSDSNLTASSPQIPIPRWPSEKVVPKQPNEMVEGKWVDETEGRRANEMVEADDVGQKRRQTSYWEYYNDSSGLLWTNTTVRG
jgi:hypothetical protein